MSNEFGYIPESPEQSFGNNKGIFTPTDIYDLTRADKYTNYGQLELIETQTASNVANLDFTDLKEDIYNVHFLTATDIDFSSTNISSLSIRFFENGTLESASVYEFAYQRCAANGTFTETKSTGYSSLRLTTAQQQNEKGNGYSYFYNLGNSSKYSFQTMHSTLENNSNVFEAQYGSGVLPQASTVDKIRLFDINGDNIYGTFSLYGIKEYS